MKKNIFIFLFFICFRTFSQELSLLDSATQFISDFGDELDQRKRDLTPRGEIEFDGVDSIDGIYTLIASEEMDEGAKFDDLGNLALLLQDTGKIVSKIKENPSSRDLILIGEFLSKECSKCDQYSEINYSLPVKFKLMTFDKRQLTPKQIRIIEDVKETSYHIVEGHKSPMIAKVTKLDNGEIKISYYRKEVKNEALKKKEDPISPLLVNGRILGNNGRMNYDLIKGDLTFSFADFGNSIELKSTLSKMKVRGKVDVGDETSLNSDFEFEYENALERYQLFFEKDGRRVVGVELEESENDYGVKDTIYSISSELYRKRTERYNADVLIERKCTNGTNVNCQNWLKFQLRF